MTMHKRRRVRLAELEAVLSQVLEDLSMSDDRRKPWVVVKDTTTERFLQFATVMGPALPPHALLLDLPEGPAHPVKTMRPVLKGLGLLRQPVTIPIDPKWTWQLGVTPAEGAKLAAEIFVRAFGAGDTGGAPSIEIEEGGNASDLS